jgi:methyl-accepting chemotaxis protein
MFLLIITIFVSHKIIGPIFKISGHLRKISAGNLNLSALRLRKGDEGSLLCETVNELQDKYRQRFVRLKKLKDEIDNNTDLDKEQISKEIAAILDEIHTDKN